MNLTKTKYFFHKSYNQIKMHKSAELFLTNKVAKSNKHHEDFQMLNSHLTLYYWKSCVGKAKENSIQCQFIGNQLKSCVTKKHLKRSNTSTG